MDFEPTEERRLLDEVVGAALRNCWSPDDVRQSETDRQLPAKLWPVLHELGVTTLGLDGREEQGGSSLLDQVVVARALGANLAPLTFVWSCGLATELALAAPPDLQSTLEQSLRSGKIVTVGIERPGRMADPMAPAPRGPREHFVVPCATGASFALLLQPPADEAADVEMALVELGAQAGEPLDRSDLQDVQRIRRDNFATSFAVPVPAIRAAVARFKILMAVYAVGAAQRVTDLATAYARERHQFGRPIGSFQAVAHRCADMHVAVTSADALTSLAAWQQATHRNEQAWRSAALAKADATEALANAAAAGLQIFGGHGFSVENDIQLFFRLGRGLEATWGTPTQEREAAGAPVATAAGEVAV